MTNPIKIIDVKKLKEKPNQEEVWNAISAPWRKYVVNVIPIVEEFLKDKEGKIIDLGCGVGRNMIKGNYEYYGVDFSEGQLIHARRYAKKEKIKAKFFKQSASELDKKIFKDEMFDYGLFIATLHCIEGKENRLKALKDFYRILKKDAEALISVWNSEDLRFKGKGKDIYMSWLENRIAYMRYYHLYDKKEFISLLKKVGFKIEEIYKSREHDRFSKKNLIVRVKKV